MIKRVFPVLALAIFSSMLGAGIVVPLLPLYAESMGASGLWLGFIFAGFSISRTIFTPIFGRLSDRKGRKLILCVGLFAYALISFTFVLATSVYQLVLVRTVHGITGAMILPIAQAYIGDLSPEGEEGKWMGYSNAAFFSGFGVGPLMGGVLAAQWGMNLAFITMGVLNLLAFLIAVIMLPRSDQRKQAAATPVSFLDMRRSGTMVGLFNFRLAIAMGRSSFFTFLPLLAAISLGLPANLIGILIAVHVLLISILGVPGGRIADIFNRRMLVIIGSLVTSIYMFLVPLSPSFWPLLALCILGSVGSAIATPAVMALTVEEGRKYGMGSAIAAITMAMSIGMAVGPILSGVIVDFININAAFYFNAGLALFGAALFAWFTRPGKGESTAG
ncbi:MAG: MFS transporter [Dehalococcoidia bacterium]|nr:MAG: MFS transporter [Dehalococcoidia bacterium]